MKKIIICLQLIILSFLSVAQTDSITLYNSASVPSSSREISTEVYKIKPKVDIPLSVVTVGWSGYALSKIYSKDPSTAAQIMALNKNDIPSIDRSGTSVYHLKGKQASDYFFYSAMPLPLILLADKEVRKDAGKIGFLYLQAMGITGFLYTGSVYLVDRYRPLAYNPNVDMATRMRGGAKNSFFAGHVALVGTSTFFTASVFDHYHPHSKLKWVFYSAAGLATVTTGYLRYRGGQHFKTDIALGIAVGTLSGLMVPRAHRINKFLTKNKLTFTPTAGEQNGFSLAYHIK